MIEYRDILGWPGYRATSYGEIESCWLRGSGGMNGPWKAVTPYQGRKGYLRVKLSQNGRTSNMYVHRLVAESFHGVCPDGLEVAHDDGNKLNCLPGNLKFKTHAANIQDKVRHGTALIGQRNHNTKLSDNDAREVYRLCVNRKELGITQARIASMFHISQSVVSSIGLRNLWEHLDMGATG